MKCETITREVIGAAIQVHSALGPGLLESAYRACMRHELLLRGLEVKAEQFLPVHYRGIQIDAGYRADLVVESQVLVELKAVRRLMAVHDAQLLSYMKLSGLQVGLIINFHVVRLKTGIRRMVN